MIVFVFLVLSILLGFMLVFMVVKLAIVLRRFQLRGEYVSQLEAPSVTICIPARNETHAMTQCLERVLASDYKKLEVIVFDDSSHDDTSVLVRSFAHEGVRFVPGTSLPEGWLGKNHALETLAREASGDLIVFMDVDTFIRPTTISQLVTYALSQQLDMVSVIPRREDVWRANVLFGHLRYFWQLIGSRATAPAAASALWLIKRQTLLEEFGGFNDYKSMVEPVGVIAARLGLKRYHCVVSSAGLGVSYEKRWKSQMETSRRLLYPMAGATPLRGLLTALFLLFLNLPTFILLTLFVSHWTIVHLLAVWLLFGYMVCYAMFTSRTWRTGWWLGGLLWPVVMLQEFILMISSLIGYARHTVTWKGRSIHATGRTTSLVIDE